MGIPLYLRAAWRVGASGQENGLYILEAEQWGRMGAEPEVDVLAGTEEGNVVLLNRALVHAKAEACRSRPGRKPVVVVQRQRYVLSGVQSLVLRSPQEPVQVGTSSTEIIAQLS